MNPEQQALDARLGLPIYFHSVYAAMTGSVTAGLLLAHMRHCASSAESGWVLKTQREWTEETGLSVREQASARRRLRDLGIIEEKRQGIPPKGCYRFNFETFRDSLNAHLTGGL